MSQVDREVLERTADSLVRSSDALVKSTEETTRLRQQVSDVVGVLRTVAEGQASIRTNTAAIASDQQKINGTLESYMAQLNLKTNEAKGAAEDANKSTQNFLTQQASRDDAKLWAGAQMMRALKEFDRETKLFLVMILAILAVAFHFTYPVIHPPEHEGTTHQGGIK